MNVIELFAGVGGFRIGLDRANPDFYHTIWSNQFEPSTKVQHASRTYIRAFGGEGHVNEDIAKVKTKDIPDHDMLCGGFPCQDYSVARSLNQAEGIKGKKGVLWWEIYRIIKEKGRKSPKLLFLENVDRLLISPAKQRGRDFAMILQSLSDLGYYAEWRVINAADYGMPQRRRRTYILGYKKNSTIAKEIKDPVDWLYSDGVFAKAFPIEDYNNESPLVAKTLKRAKDDDLASLSESFNQTNVDRPFANAGLMMNGKFWTCRTEPNYDGYCTTLGDILVTGEERQFITEEYYIKEKDLPKWQYLKGSKHEPRTSKNGHEFIYSEGAMSFPDALDKPSRTIITAEGGSTPSRFKHVILDPINNRLRRLIPIELERLNMFPDNHTLGETDTKRAFFMGNALVCGIITKVGEEIDNRPNNKEGK